MEDSFVEPYDSQEEIRSDHNDSDDEVLNISEDTNSSGDNESAEQMPDDEVTVEESTVNPVLDSLPEEHDDTQASTYIADGNDLENEDNTDDDDTE